LAFTWFSINVCSMGVPNDVIFAPGVSFGDVRGLKLDDQLLKLRERIEHQIGVQIRSVGYDKNDENWIAHHRAPFPLAIMSCIALEALGNIFFRIEAGTSEGRDLFCYACGELDPALKRPTRKGFVGELKKQFPELDFSGSQSVAEILYKTFRNKMAHDYLAGCVYLTGEDTDSWAYGAGFLILNPFWLFEQVDDLTTKLFNGYAAEPDRLESCKQYLALLLR
jgi:hypothetical protein